MADCSAERTRREIERRRPATLHLKRTHQVPKFQYSVDRYEPSPPAEPMKKPQSSPSLSPAREQLVAQQNGEKRSVSPRPKKSEERRDSMAKMRAFKSDEAFSRPTMQKMKTLDVPSDQLLRQMSLNEPSPPGSEHSPSQRHLSLLTLTSKQKKALKASFSTLNSGGQFLRIVEQVFRRMENKFPDIRSIFLTTAFVNSLSRERESPPLVKTEHDHCKCLVGMFERIVENVDEMDKEISLLRQYGEKHAQMRDSGFTGSMIETFGELAIGVIGAQDCVKYNQDGVKAWRLLLAFITDEMKAGFDRSMKMIDRRNSQAQSSQESFSSECPFREKFERL
ncbi:unnamed protein product, partial [Mesorhabditis belari]|uniref:Globin domain-containing protein n=1 Tax=Mesorhabditis belari TaxID=2138241 RepID=A0AAF3FGK0_9BILA